jgi:hypothetical protein
VAHGSNPPENQQNDNDQDDHPHFSGLVITPVSANAPKSAKTKITLNKGLVTNVVPVQGKRSATLFPFSVSQPAIFSPDEEHSPGEPRAVYVPQALDEGQAAHELQSLDEEQAAHVPQAPDEKCSPNEH